MKNTVVVSTALAVLTACSVGPEKMFYEVTQRTTNGFSIQANKGNMDMMSEMVAQMRVHMDKMAVSECQGMGKNEAVRISERQYTTGPYYSWIEQSYNCR